MDKLNRRGFLKVASIAIVGTTLGLKAVKKEKPKNVVTVLTRKDVDMLLRRMTAHAARAAESMYLVGNETVSARDSFGNFGAAFNRYSDQVNDASNAS